MSVARDGSSSPGSFTVVLNRAVPIASFGAVTGIAALGLAWRIAQPVQPVLGNLANVFLAVAALLFVSLLVVWILRSMSHPGEVRAEANVAITASYFGLVVISCALLAAGAVTLWVPLAIALWLVAAVGGAGLLVHLLARWIERGVEVYELTPALFIPIVGNATAVYAAAALGFRECAWASFSFALVCWLTVAPIVMYRLLAVSPRLPRKMAPQLALFVSSPAVFASAWYSLTGDIGPFFLVFTFKALFFTFVVARLWKIGYGEPYNVAMWGYTFPAAALASALERYAHSAGTTLGWALATSALVAATFAVVLCGVQTAIGWVRLLNLPKAADSRLES